MKTKNWFLIGLIVLIGLLMSLGGFAQTKIVYVQLVDTLVVKAEYRAKLVSKIGYADVNLYGVGDCLDNRLQCAGLATLIDLLHKAHPNNKVICVLAQKTDKGFNFLYNALIGYNLSRMYAAEHFDGYNLELEVWNEANGISRTVYFNRLALLKKTFGSAEVYWGKYTTQADFDSLVKYCNRILLAYYFDCRGMTTLSQFGAKCKSSDNGRIEAIGGRIPIYAIYNTKPEFCGAYITQKGIANCYAAHAKLVPGKLSGYCNYILKL